MKPHELEKWSFYWSEGRLLIAAVALLLNGTPPVYLLLPASAVTMLLLKLSWLISGIASLYIAYRWYTAKHDLFGRKEAIDSVALFIMVVTGLNLGFAGLTQSNIGMSITSNYVIYFLAAALYLWTALYLWKRWNKAGRRLF